MLIANIQLLSDKDYSKAIPDGYVINVKSLEMKKAVVQIAKRQETDKVTVYHHNTDKFLQTHPDAVEGSVLYIIDSNTDHIDLIATAEPAVGLTDSLTAITGRMLHRTQKLASRIEAEARKAKRNAAPAAASEPEQETEAETESEAETSAEESEA